MKLQSNADIVTGQKRFHGSLIIILLFIVACVSLFLDVFLSQLYQSTNTQTRHQLMENQIQSALKVPFYVYDNELDYSDFLMWDQPVKESYHSNYKHGDDYWLLQSALRHPMRTYNPEEAELFFVPTLFNAVMEGVLAGVDYSFCSHGVCDPMKHFSFVNKHLNNSNWFQRSQGRNHVVVFSHFVGSLPWFKINAWNLMKCNMITFEDMAPPQFLNRRRIAIGKMHLGFGCQHEEDKRADFAFIGTVKPSFQDRSNVCNWIQNGTYTYTRCGGGDRCPALAEAKYGFHMKGDSWGANRLIDTLLSGTVPLFTAEEQYHILPESIPWRNLSYLVNVSSHAAFNASMEYILSRPQEEYEEKQRLIEMYSDVWNHTKDSRFDLYMAEFAVKLGLQPADGYFPFLH